VVSFYAFKSGCKLTLERKERGLEEGTPDIIRLLWWDFSLEALDHQTFFHDRTIHMQEIQMLAYLSLC
jgi:hypothetical protein